MKIIIAVILTIVLLALAVQVYFIRKERNQLRDKFENLSAKSQSLFEENSRIKSEIEYYSNPENLEKELKAKFNYKNLDEKMMIVVP